MLDLIASTPTIRLAMLIAIFLVVVMLCVGVFTLTSRRVIVRGELREIRGGPAPPGAAESLSQRRNTAWERLVDRVEKAGLSLADTKSDELRERLKAAGYLSPAAPRFYTLIRLILVLALPTGFILLSLVAGRQMTFMQTYLIGTIAALFGLVVPALFVRVKADRRKEQIVNGFPDCLDLMLVCVEAGLGLESAMDRVGREMSDTHPLVAGLMIAANLRLRAGETREAALRRMAEESGVDEIRSFATLLIQSDRLGTSISSTLRVYASEMRERRRMRAEEKAHRLPVLISIPLVTCMLPVMIGTLMLPAAIRVMVTLVPLFKGGH